MEIPCESCLKLPVCRHKDYRLIIDECDDIMNILYFSDEISQATRKKRYSENIVRIEKIMKPTKWYTYESNATQNVLISGEAVAKNVKIHRKIRYRKP